MVTSYSNSDALQYGLCGCVFFILAEDSTWRNFSFALVLGVVASFSMASGLLYWVVGAGVLFNDKRSEKWRLRSTIWVVIGIICGIIFWNGWISKRLNIAFIIDNFPQYTLFILNFIGSPINPSAQLAWMFGCVGLMLFTLLFGYVIKHNTWMHYIPHVAIILFILLSIASISTGRLNLGLEQARVSRYHILSIWYWASLLAMLPAVNIKIVYKTIFCLVLVVSLSRLMYTGYINGQIGIYQHKLPAYQAAQTGKIPGYHEMLLIYPRPSLIESRLIFLYDHKLSGFA